MSGVVPLTSDVGDYVMFSETSVGCVMLFLDNAHKLFRYFSHWHHLLSFLLRLY